MTRLTASPSETTDLLLGEVLGKVAVRRLATFPVRGCLNMADSANGQNGDCDLGGSCRLAMEYWGGGWLLLSKNRP